jgi:hypothetical protein
MFSHRHALSCFSSNQLIFTRGFPMILRNALASAILFTIPLTYATPANAQTPATTILRRGMDLPVKIGSTVSSDSVRAGAMFYGTIPINLIDRGRVVFAGRHTGHSSRERGR